MVGESGPDTHDEQRRIAEVTWVLDNVDCDRDVLGGGQVRGVGSQSGALHQSAAVYQDGGDETSGDYRGSHGAPDPASPDNPESGRIRT